MEAVPDLYIPCERAITPYTDIFYEAAIQVTEGAEAKTLEQQYFRADVHRRLNLASRVNRREMRQRIPANAK